MARATLIANSFTTADRALRQIGDQVTAYVTTGESAMTTLGQVAADLGMMDDPFPDGWVESVTYINAQAAANPSDPAWSALKAKQDKIVADFVAAKQRFDAIAAAIAGM